ncbi:hypothetical protein NQZ68_025203 [Dissostichus eleginoides]|nr:hypothetical protein NQZ68_025203 [Dissostichus eleginoides]
MSAEEGNLILTLLRKPDQQRKQVPRPMSPPNGCSSSWLPILHPTPLRAQRQMGRHGDRQARRPQTSSQSVLEKKALKLHTMREKKLSNCWQKANNL